MKNPIVAFPKKIAVIVKPNAKKTAYLGFDKDENSYAFNLAAPAENDKANIELLKFIKKISKKNAKILFGLKNKRKIIQFVD